LGGHRVLTAHYFNIQLLKPLTQRLNPAVLGGVVHTNPRGLSPSKMASGGWKDLP